MERLSVIEAATAQALTRLGLTLPRELSLEEWVRVGIQLKSISESSTWWLADWLLFGEANYRGRYRVAVERSGLDYQTLRNYAWVARRFPPVRRHGDLSFAHHAEVTPLTEPEQEYWLRRASELGWSRNRLRREIRVSLAERTEGSVPASAAVEAADRSAGDAGPDRGGAAVHPTIEVRLPSDKLDLCLKAAASSGVSLDEWIALVLNDAVGAQR